jgi:TPR repeat protein
MSFVADVDVDQKDDRTACDGRATMYVTPPGHPHTDMGLSRAQLEAMAESFLATNCESQRAILVCYELGVALMQDETTSSTARAYRLFAHAASAGDAPCAFNAVACVAQLASDPDHDLGGHEALRLLEEYSEIATRGGFPELAGDMTMIYHGGASVGSPFAWVVDLIGGFDYTRAAHWGEMAVSRGHEASVVRLVESCYKIGDPTRAIPSLEACVAAGGPIACNVLAAFYDDTYAGPPGKFQHELCGKGMADYARAEELYRLGIELGDFVSLQDLQWMLVNLGEHKKLRQLLTDLLLLPNGSMTCKLEGQPGFVGLHGFAHYILAASLPGCSPSIFSGHWLKAAELGVPFACSNVAVQYLTGSGVSQNIPAFIRFKEKGAQLGVVDDALDLVRHYQGVHNPQFTNPQKEHYWREFAKTKSGEEAPTFSSNAYIMPPGEVADETAVPKGDMKPCNGCQASFRRHTLKACQACSGGAHYCSRECQKKHWKAHKKTCNQTRKSAGK